MANVINATSTGNGGLVSTGDDSGILNIQTNETTAITVDTSQNVGIGTSSPTNKLHVVGTAKIEGSTLDLNDAGTFTISQNTTSSALVLRTAASSYMRFDTNGSNERMRIDSSGNLQLKGTGGTSTFNVFGNATITDQVQIFNNPTSSAQGILFRNTFNTGPSIFSTGAATTNAFISWVGGSGTQGSIVGNGSGINYNTTSDYRLKENVAPMTGALGVVAQLKPRTYTWKFDGADGHGFIAHELQEIFPAAVSGEKDAIDKEGNPEYQGVDTSFLVATLTAALQETKALLDTQAETINALTARIVALEGQ